MQIPIISADQITSTIDYPLLVQALKKGLIEDITTPMRKHYNLNYKQDVLDPTLLLMPAWQVKKYIGIKLVTIFPENKIKPSIQGSYLLIDGQDGSNLCMLEAKKLTTRRTAAISALMSSYLSRKDAKTLLMIGTGNLAPELIQAHCAIRPINKIIIWGRNSEKSKTLASQMKSIFDVDLKISEDLNTSCQEADIISAATMSEQPLIYGQYVNPGTHVDLVGSYKPTMREGDDSLIRKSSVFVDTIEGATQESGDLVIPLANQALKLSDIKATMHDLCRGKHPGRKSPDEITWFKSVGHASEDLIAAYTIYERWKK